MTRVESKLGVKFGMFVCLQLLEAVMTLKIASVQYSMTCCHGY